MRGSGTGERALQLALVVLIVAVALFGFLSFFFVFLLAPIVPLSLFYLAYLGMREARTRSGHRSEQALLAREAAARRRQLQETA